MEQELKMETTASNIVKLSNVVLNDLAFSKHLLGKLSKLNEEGSLDEDLFIDLSTAIIGSSITKAICLKALVVEDCPFRPSDEGVELIEFWLEAGRQLEELEDEDEQED